MAERRNPKKQKAPRAQYYRIQPAGLGIRHRSETSVEELAEGLHVFDEPWETLRTDSSVDFYGDEVVVISAPGHRPTDDVEGVEIDFRKAKIVDRMSLDEWASRLAREAGLAGRWSYEKLRTEYEYSPEIEEKIQGVTDESLVAKKKAKKKGKIMAKRKDPPSVITVFYDQEDPKSKGWAYNAVWFDDHGNTVENATGTFDGRAGLSHETAAKRAKQDVGHPRSRITVVRVLS